MFKRTHDSLHPSTTPVPVMDYNSMIADAQREIDRANRELWVAAWALNTRLLSPGEVDDRRQTAILDRSHARRTLQDAQEQAAGYSPSLLRRMARAVGRAIVND